MSERSDVDLVRDMLEAASRAVQYCANLDYADFENDTKTQDAVVRNIEILGEATKNLSKQIRDQCDFLPWKNIAGMRDRLIHDYFGVNWDIVWDVVIHDLPDMINSLNRILTDG